MVYFHEPWGDEVHAWAIAGDSHSFADLLYNTRYEGHPKLWYILLFILQKATHRILIMQILHVCIAACTVFVFCFYSPFSFIKNILFCFGYFFAYEYSIISRNYAIEAALLFLCAGFYSKHGSKYLLLISALFFMLFQTNVYAVIIGAPFYVFIIWKLYQTTSVKRKRIFLSVAIILLGIFISAISMKPPVDSGFSEWDTKIDLLHSVKVLSTLYSSYFPLPLLQSRFWNTNILYNFSQHLYIGAFLSILILIGVIRFFRGNKAILFLFCAGTFGVFLFTYTKYQGELRHYGHMFLLFVICYWLYTCDKDKSSVNIGSGKFNLIFEKYVIPLILVVQFGSACFATAADIRYPFSNDEPVARYIKANELDRIPILGDGDYMVSGIAGILGEKIFFMNPKYWGDYITLDNKWGKFNSFSLDDLSNRVDSISEQNESDVIVIVSYPLNIDELKNWTLLQTFNNSIIGEDYSIYKVTYEPDAAQLNKQGVALISKGFTAQAIHKFMKAVKLKPDYATAYMNLANCYNNVTGGLKKASMYIDSAIKYAPDNVNAIYTKGAILFNSGNYKDALTYFKKTEKISPGSSDAYVSVARCYISSKDNDNAILHLKKALAIDTANCDTFKLLVQCYKDKGNTAQANAYATRAEKCR